MSSVSQAAQQLVDSAIAGLNDSSIGKELFAVANLLEDEKTLRRNLADAGASVDQRHGVVQQLLGDKISAQTLAVVKTVVGARWSNPQDLIAGLERAGATVLLAAAEQAGAIDQVEDEVFYFARLVDSDPQLQMALTDSATSAAAKVQLVNDLLSGRAHESTTAAVAQFVSHRRSRRIGVALDQLSELAAGRRGRIVATVTSAIALTSTQQSRLGEALKSIYAREILIDEVVDPSVIGGISVDVAGEIIDGTIASRLEQARRQLLA
jgi:F-type H+-transporting ATPase subunit delta